MKRIALASILLFLITFSFAQEDEGRVDLLFAGDIMTHDDQLASARIGDDKWDFNSWFLDIEHILKSADYCIGNLEVPLGVEPFKGYPSFGAPAIFARHLKKAGFNVLLTANNHTFDRRKKGALNTIKVLDSLEIMNLGTYRNKSDREEKLPLIIEHEGIKIALLNYTYGSNALVDYDMISILNKNQIRKDIEKAKQHNPDKIIVLPHWGTEYKSFPSSNQKEYEKVMYSAGADVVIGAHPHVLQPMIWKKNGEKEKFTAYSLGNLISNMYFKRTDGGALLHIQLRKDAGGQVFIDKASYILLYNYKYRDENGHIHYRLRPIHEYKDHPEMFKDDSYKKMLKYKSLADPVMKYNKNVPAWAE